MKHEVGPVFLKMVHRYGFRPGEQALVLGLVVFLPCGIKPPRPCFKVQYADNFIDYVPVSEWNPAEIIFELGEFEPAEPKAKQD